MNRRLAHGGGAFLLVAAAVAVAVLAVDVLRWRGHLEAADMRYASRTGAAKMWEPDLWFRGVTKSMLGIDDDVELREALRRFRLARVREAPRSLQDVTRRSEVEAVLARIARGGADAETRSLAATLRGALAFEEARSGGEQPGVFLRRSLSAFREAVRLDPSNEDAKYDYELVLRLLQTVGGESSAGAGARRGNISARGAGAASSGGGF